MCMYVKQLAFTVQPLKEDPPIKGHCIKIPLHNGQN